MPMNTPSAPSVALRYAAARVASGVYFHGTSEEAARKIMQQGFSLRGVGQRQRAVHGDDTLDPKGVFVTSDLMQARWYAGPDPKRPGLNRGGAVVEVKVSGRMMSESDWWKSKRRISEEMGITGLYDPRRGEVVLRAQEEAKKQGYAGFHEHGDEYVVFDPKNVKPVRAFHAGSGEPLSKTASRIDAPPAMLKAITEWVWSLMASEILRNVERVRGHRKNPIRWQRTVDLLGEDEAWGTLVDLAETERLAKKYGGKMPSGPLPKGYTKDFPVDLRGWKHERYVKDLLDAGKGSPLARMFMDHPITVQWVTSPRHAPSRVRGPGGSTPKGTWDAIGLLRLFMSAPSGADPRMVKRRMNEVARVVRHELQHLAQTVLENATNLDTAGMPAGGERGRVSPHSSTEDEHALRDVEFYTRLQDDIDEFLRLRGKFGPAGDDRVTRKAIGVWVGEEPAQGVGMWSLRPSRFFTELRKHDRRKYRKAVGEFWAAVSEGGTPSYRFASKTAARPLRLDRSAVNRLLDDLYKQVERSSSGRSRRELGYGWLAESTFTVTTPKGDRREVIVELNTVPMKPSFRGVVVKGGYGYIKGKDDLKVWLTLNGSLTPDQFLNRRRTEKEIRAAMMHELTHASEVKGTLADLKVTRVYDYQDEPHAYHNDPVEVRAWMRQVYEELRDDPRAGVVPIEVLLENNRWWKQAEPHLTRKSRNRILKGLVTAFEDEGIEVRPTRKTAARPIRLPTREIKTLAKRLAQRLYRYGLPKPGRVIAQEYLPLTNVKGDEVVVEIWLTGTPGWNHDPFGSKLLNGGSFRRRPEGPLPLILMYVNPHLDPRTFEMRPRRIVEDELYRLLAHELTHAADIWLGKGSVGDLSGSRDDLKKHHHNHSAEVKALMRDVVTHLDDGDVVREFMGYGMDFNTALREALKDTKWPEIEPYLTPRNKKTILKGVYTFLQDQGLDEVAR